MADKVIIEAEVKSNIGEVSKDASNAAAEFKIMGVSLNGVKAGFASAAVTAKGMFGSIKAGLLSTGIGAFIVAIGSLVSYFTNTKKGSEALARTMAGLGAVVKILTNLFSSVGETMVNAFNNPKKAIEDLWEGIKTNLMNRLTGIIDGFKAVGKVIHGVFTMDWEEVAEGAKEYGEAIVQIATGYDTQSQKEFLDNLNKINESLGKAFAAEVARTDALQRLTDAQRALNVETAESIAWIEKQKLIAEDITKTYEEREAAATKAFNREKELEGERIVLAATAVRLEKERHELLGENGVLAADLDRLAELEINLANVRQESAGRQISLQNFLNALRNEELTKLEEIKAAEIERFEGIEKLVTETIEANDQLIQADNSVLDNYLANNAKKKKDAKLLADAQKGMALDGLALAVQIAGEGSAIGKAAAVASATISGVEGVQNAFSTAQKSPITALMPAYPFIQAGLAGAFSAIQIQKILSGSPSGGSGGSGGVTPSAPSPPAPQMMSGAFDLTGGVAPEATRAFVVTDEMTNSQNQLANIRRRATI